MIFTSFLKWLSMAFLVALMGLDPGAGEAPPQAADVEDPPRKFEIERRTKLSYAAFTREYLYPNRPVILTDALTRWPALKRWTPEFFQRTFGAMRLLIEDRQTDAAANEWVGRTSYTMAEFIDRVLDSSEGNPAPYFRNQVLGELFPALTVDIEPLPEYFQPNWLSDRYLVPAVRKALNRAAAIEIYIGGNGGSFPLLHYDGSGTHAFLMQIHGRKQFTIFPPEQERFLYPSPNKANVSLINSVDQPDLVRFPLFARAVPTMFVLAPGELFFVPSRWWHITKMLSPSITLSINVANQSNWPAVVTFVSQHRRNRLVSLASRMYLSGAGAWRGWRDRNWTSPNTA